MIELSYAPIALGNTQTAALYLDQKELSHYLFDLTQNLHVKDLILSWTNLEGAELDYVLDLLKTQKNINLPILICSDDVDLWCTVLVAKVKHLDNEVMWEKIGFVKGKYDIKEWNASGLKNTDLWTDEDWIFFDEDFQMIQNNLMTWDDLCSKYWDLEEPLRLRQYFHEYYNTDQNIEWIYNEPLIFDKTHYYKIIKQMTDY